MNIDAAFAESGLAALGYTCHMRSADGDMRMYSSVDKAAAVLIKKVGDELRCKVYTLLPRSLMKVEIGEISFPHPNIVKFIFQIERVNKLWLDSEGQLR